jgi:hypothetical protein
MVELKSNFSTINLIEFFYDIFDFPGWSGFKKNLILICLNTAMSVRKLLFGLLILTSNSRSDSVSP